MAVFREERHASLGRVLRATAPISRGAVLAREKPVLSMTPLRALALDERRTLLRAVSELGASTLDLLCAAHAYAHAPKSVRATVLATFCGMEAVPTEGAKLEAVSDVEHVARWWTERAEARGGPRVDAAELTQALMAFQLNAHHTPQLGDRRCGALYALGSRFTHACASANCAFAHDGDGALVHRAVRAIENGEVLTANYLGPWEYGSARVRRAALMRSKCFECRCATCLVAADAMRAMPCPACGARRGADGLLADDGAGTEGAGALDGALDGAVLPVALGGGCEEWRCARCGLALSADAMDVRIAEGDAWPLTPCARGHGAGTLLEWERRVEAAAHNLLMIVYASRDGDAHAALARLPAIVRAVRALLGARHWVVAFLVAIQLEATVGLASRMADAPEAELLAAARGRLGLPVSSLGELLAACARMALQLHRWHRARAPLAAAPFFEDVCELAELACRVVASTAAAAARDTILTVVALVRVDLE
ncbi:hypothetical protein KFE25_009472 [Diacronema lutheri]|uniref:SET domain-containing protein n=1 Tax=Diacronema lutheri TaxID=2081491 RepID=A0A8J6CHD7_DIALT|nr:hypothetical protein KFE25_009472 [Diacronema lutheri]